MRTACNAGTSDRPLGDTQDGATPIFIAASKGNVECVDTLARFGADVNQPTVVRALCTLGSCPRASFVESPSALPAQKGTTPHAIALRFHHTACVEALVRHVAEAIAVRGAPSPWSQVPSDASLTCL